MESGHTKWLDAVQKLESAIANNKWPGYSVDGVLPLSAPRWSQSSFAEETDGNIL
jgi:hypothetical protein